MNLVRSVGIRFVSAGAELWKHHLQEANSGVNVSYDHIGMFETGTHEDAPFVSHCTRIVSRVC